MKCLINGFLFLVVLSITATASGQTEMGEVETQLKNLKNADFQKAWDASQRLAEFPQYKSQIVPGLVEALKYEWNQCTGDIRDSIAYTLSELDAKETVPDLLKLLRSRKTLEHECSSSSCLFLPVTPADEISARAYDPLCRQGVLMAINKMADSSHHKEIMSLINSGVSKPELLITLAEGGTSSNADFIARFKDEKDVEVRRSVATAMGMVKNDALSIPILIRYLGDDADFSVKWAAAESLTILGRESKSTALMLELSKLMTKSDKLAVVLSARTLAILGDEKGVLKLRELTADADSKIRFEAVLALGVVADKGSIDLLVKRLNDANLSVRAAIIHALGQTGNLALSSVIQTAFTDAEAYQKELKDRFRENTSTLHNVYGVNVYNLEVTFEEAIRALNKIED